MFYFLFLFTEKVGGFVGLILAWAVGLEALVEAWEQSVLILLTGLCFWLVWPAVESGMLSWVLVSVGVISAFLWSTSPLSVYCLFELSLVPIVVLVAGWGTQPERIAAGFYFLVYTLVFSFPLFLLVVFMETFNFCSFSFLFLFFAALAFMVKMPLFLVHVWLPKTHVEAPTAGSILLAGILLKMGGIGFLWIQSYCLGEWSLLFFLCAVVGAVFSSLVCSFQSDIKAFVAYSSVAHMNYVVVVMSLGSEASNSSASLLMVSHGLVSSMMFLVAGSCFHYWGSRVVFFLRGVFLFKSSLAFGVWLVLVANLAVPPSLGMLGEVLSFLILFSCVWGSAVFLMVYLFFVAYFSIFLGFALQGEGFLVFGEKGAVLLWTTVALFDFVWIVMW